MNYIEEFIKNVCKKNKVEKQNNNIILEGKSKKGSDFSGNDNIVENTNTLVESFSTASKHIDMAKNTKVKENKALSELDIKNQENVKIPQIQKDLVSFLDNNSDLDNSLLKMNKDIKIEKNDNNSIEFVKNDKSLKWIFIQFIVGLLLIGFTYSYVQKHPAEQKFLNSSISLWINTFQNLLGKVGGIFTQKVDDSYILKRKEMIEKMISYEFRVKKCLENIKDDNEKKNLEKLLYKIQTFKNFLMDTNNLSLRDFINNYTQYNLYIYSLEQAVNQVCK